MSDHELERLEALLRAQPLRAPSAELERRVGRLWGAAPQPNQVLRRRVAWSTALAAALTAAAALAVAIYLARPKPLIAPPIATPPAIVKVLPPAAETKSKDRSPAEEPSEPAIAPVEIEQVWSQPTGHEVVESEGGLPVSRVEEQVVRQVQRIDNQRHVYIQWTMPAEETREVPLEYN